jgi:hypothetical protein
VRVNLSDFKNYIFFDSTAKPVQSFEKFNLTDLGVNGQLNVKKVFLQFVLRSQHAENATGQKPDYIKIPDFAVWSSFFFKGHMFKKTLYAKAGVDFNYFSAYHAQYYDPTIRQFYNQNNVSIGNYPVFDIFFTGYVKTFSLGLKLEHANQGFSGDRYYSSTHYPMPPRVFKVLISWKFLDKD